MRCSRASARCAATTVGVLAPRTRRACRNARWVAGPRCSPRCRVLSRSDSALLSELPASLPRNEHPNPATSDVPPNPPRSAGRAAPGRQRLLQPRPGRTRPTSRCRRAARRSRPAEPRPPLWIRASWPARRRPCADAGRLRLRPECAARATSTRARRGGRVTLRLPAPARRSRAGRGATPRTRRRERRRPTGSALASLRQGRAQARRCPAPP
jgi:hypothetical protein